MLNVTDVRITKIEGDEKLRGFAAVVLDDCFLVSDFRVVEGEEVVRVAVRVAAKAWISRLRVRGFMRLLLGLLGLVSRHERH